MVANNFDAETGGILLTKSHSFISRLISWGESLDVHDTFEPSHVAIVADRHHIWEATIGGVQYSPLEKYLGKGHTTFIALCRELTRLDRMNIVKWAERFKGKQYGYADLLVYLADILGQKVLLPNNFFTKLFNKPDRLVCSELVAYCYGRGAHYRFRDTDGKWIPPSSVRPDDIWRHIFADPNWKIYLLSGDSSSPLLIET